MTFYIDAWLDCPNPYVKVVNKNNQQVMADFSGRELSKAFEQGDIYMTDFLDADGASQLELIKSLLLLRCCQNIYRDIQNINQSVRGACLPATVFGNGSNVVPFSMNHGT